MAVASRRACRSQRRTTRINAAGEQREGRHASRVRAAWSKERTCAQARFFLPARRHSNARRLLAWIAAMRRLLAHQGIVATWAALLACALLQRQPAAAAANVCPEVHHDCMVATVDVKVVPTQPGGSVETLLTVKALYGDVSPQDTVAGELVRVVDSTQSHTGCSAYAPLMSTLHDPWTALVQRGGCNISTKIEEAVIQRGAVAVIVYNDAYHTMDGICVPGYNVTVVQMSYEEADKLLSLLDQTAGTLSVTISKDSSALDRWRMDPLTIVVVVFAAAGAVLLNMLALMGILSKKEKLKPHQLLVVNLITTDLAIGLFSALQLALRYDFLRHDVCQGGGTADETPSPRVAEANCAGALLSRFWNVLMYSNMFTLLLITAEHFFACRWPFHHKVILTRGKMAACILVCWVASATPDAVVFAMECDDMARRGDVQLCEYLEQYSAGSESWQVSIFVVSLLSVVLATLVAVYAYILCLIHKVNISIIEAKKKRTAAVTSLLLVLSFVLSYAFFYCVHFSIVVHRSVDNVFVESQRRIWESVSPTAQLLGDYVVTGVIGAILDPVIYCSRTRKLKALLFGYFSRNDERQRLSTSAAGTGKEARSPSTDYTAVTSAHTDEDSL